jgi:hypothetical protein
MICTTCEKDKEPEEFSWKNKAAGKYNVVCKVCQRAYAKEHYKRNVQYYVKKGKRARKKARKENYTLVYFYLLEHPCVRCGEADPRVLDFHHTRDKVATISEMIGGSQEMLVKEIEKCIVLCANCHRLRTFEDAGGHPYTKLGLM